MTGKTELEELLSRAMSLCSKREYCISDIRALCKRWGAEDSMMQQQVIERLVKERFIDEYRYARAFALDHFRYNRWGRVKIRVALKNKQVDPGAVAEGLEAISEEEYLEMLVKILNEQQRRIKSANKMERRARLLRHALGKGFESHLVYEAINSLVDS